MIARSAAIVLVVCWSFLVRPDAQQAVFSSRTEAVRVDVLVTNNGQIVRGLQARDFEILDNGITQQVDLVSFEQLPVNVILALDMSASVVGERLDQLRGAGHAVLSGLTSSDRAALMTFSHTLTLQEPLTPAIVRVQRQLDAVKPQGMTALVDATYAAVMMGESDVGRDLLIVFSDGRDTSSWLSPGDVIEAARRSDVVVYGVSVRGSGRAEFLRDLSETTGGTFLEAGSTRDLRPAFLRILDEFRQRYVVSYVPRGVEHAGWHQLQVRIRDRRATVKARAGYQVD